MERLPTLILFIITCEALTEMTQRAAPVVWLLSKIRSKTPLLYSETFSTHMFDCKYCMSVWISLFLFILYIWWSEEWVLAFMVVITVHRLSNYLHLLISIIRDKQMDMRIKRGS